MPTAQVQTEFQAPAESVFQAWLEPAMVSRWMFGPALRDETVIHIQTEPHPGGVFSFLVDRQAQRLDHVGRYMVVEKPTKLQFTWAIGEITLNDSVVTIEIKPTATGCVLNLAHEMHPDWAEYVDRCRDAWAKMLGVLQTVLATDSNG